MSFEIIESLFQSTYKTGGKVRGTTPHNESGPKTDFSNKNMSLMIIIGYIKLSKSFNRIKVGARKGLVAGRNRRNIPLHFLKSNSFCS